MIFLVDDEKDLLPNGEVPDVILRKPVNALGLIEAGWMKTDDMLYLDHDMGDDVVDGHYIASRIEALWKQSPKWAVQNIPRYIYCVSNNPQGRKRIEQAIANVNFMRDEYEAILGKVEEYKTTLHG